MVINPEIKEALQKFGIPTNDGLTVLLSIYFDAHRNTINPTTIYSKLQIAGIISWDDKTNSTIWNIPLFEGQETVWGWVKDWIQLFGDKNKDRKGSVKLATPRMKKFFSQNPDIRKEEVMQATILYLRSIDKPYVTTSHYFISKGIGADKTSGLLEWVERLREDTSKTIGVVGNDLTNRMQ